jgi:hypothetical protein
MDASRNLQAGIAERVRFRFGRKKQRDNKDKHTKLDLTFTTFMLAGLLQSPFMPLRPITGLSQNMDSLAGPYLGRLIRNSRHSICWHRRLAAD